jgi:hypothetical protein
MHHSSITSALGLSSASFQIGHHKWFHHQVVDLACIQVPFLFSHCLELCAEKNIVYIPFVNKDLIVCFAVVLKYPISRIETQSGL